MWTTFIFECVLIMIAGSFGIVGNCLLIFKFIQLKIKVNFHWLMLALAIYDTIYISLCILLFAIPQIFEGYKIHGYYFLHNSVSFQNRNNKTNWQNKILTLNWLHSIHDPQCLFPGWINEVLQSDVIVKSKHGLRTCSSRRFQWYPTTYMCWAMTKPLLWIKLILSHSKGWVGLNTYRLHSCPNRWSLKIAGREILSQHWN